MIDTTCHLMQRASLVGILVGALVAAPLPAAADIGFTTADNAIARTLSVNGASRSYLVAPILDTTTSKMRVVARQKRYPIIVLLHGGTDTARDVWQQTTLPSIAAQKQVILVAPQGIGNQWNDGRSATMSGNAASTADDVEFLRQVILDVATRYRGDTTSVLMVGVSNGGFMTMRYACERGGDLRAAGNVASALFPEQAAACPSTNPIPWISINGNADAIVPFEGQSAGRNAAGQPTPAMLSASDTFDFWATRARCRIQRQIAQLSGVSTSDKFDLQVRTREGCVGGATSTQYVLIGAGHTWPGMPNTAGVRLVGGSSPDIDAGTVVWTHFAKALGVAP